MFHSRILKPSQIPFDMYNIKDIFCGKTFSAFLTDKNEALVCGVNDLNQLGIEQPKSTSHIYKSNDLFGTRCMDVVIPLPIECFLNMKVKKIACGESHCLAVIEDQSNKFTTLWSWGNNKFGQLGQGTQISKSMPKPINYILGYTKSRIIDVKLLT
jgi:alpha-tubulin suppressor-like RCC1 family protein